MKRLLSAVLCFVFLLPPVLSVPSAQAGRTVIVKKRGKVIKRGRRGRRGRRRAVIVAPNTGRPVRVIVR